MTAVLSIVRVSSRQLLGRRRIIGLTLLSLIAPFIFFMASRATTATRTTEEFLGILVSFQLGIVMAVITIVIASSALGEELRLQTMSFLVVRPLPRWALVVGKLVTAWLVSFAVTLVGALTMAILHATRDGDWSLTVPTIVTVAIGTLGYSALFLPLGYLVKRATIVGMIYVFLWELAISTPITALAPTSIWKTTNVALAGLIAGTGVDFDFDVTIGTMAPGAGGSLVKFLVLAAVSVGLTSYLLRQRDIR